MSKRGNGEGSVYKRSDGRWAGAVDLGWEGGKRRRKVVYGRTQQEALVKLRQAQRQLVSHGSVPDDRITVKQHLTQWLAGKEGRVAPHTLEIYSTIIRLHVLPDLGRKRLAKLTATDVERLMQSKRALGPEGKPLLAVSTVNKLRAILVQALTQAQRRGLVVINAAALTDGLKQQRAEGRSLTQPEARAFLAAAKGDRLEALYVVLISLGLRRGEALGLTWEDVDLDAGTVHICRALKRERLNPLDDTRAKSRLVLGDVKTAGSRRQLNLPAPVVDALRAHRVRQLAERLAAGTVWHDTGLVFTTDIGTPIEPRNFVRLLSALCKRAGLGHWHPHELRHSAASLLLAQNVPLEVVSEILGHSSIRMTKDVYGHLVGPQKQHAAEAMSRALFG